MPYDITIASDLFNGDVDAAESLASLNIWARALAEDGALYLRLHPDTPLLYQSGVRYVPELPGQERWQDIPTTLKRGQGDCEDLAAGWRAPELNVRFGIPARPEVIVTRRLPNGKYLYHVIVRMPDGSIEDPSYFLGMRRNST